MTERPTPTEVRRAKKAELVAWCEEFGLDAEGKVDELRERILDFLKSAPEEAVTPEEAAEPAGEGEEGPAAEEAEEEAEEAEEAEEEEAEGKKVAAKGKAKAAEAFTPKQKAKLEPDIRALLRLRMKISRRRPEFHRQEWFRHPRLTDAWRKGQGMHSKVRRHFGYRPNVPSIGFRGPQAVRGLHPSGFREVLVHNVQELDAIDPKVEAARIAGTVGTRRRLEIQAAADEKGIRVLNRRGEE